MTAPHFHTASEAKKAINKIEHNTLDATGAPTGIKGGSAGNATTFVKGVNNKSKGDDYVSSRGIKSAK